MKRFIVITSTLLFNLSIGQQKIMNFISEDFGKQVLNYQPTQKTGVSDKDYNKGVFILDETKLATKNNPANLNSADYWNITMAFLKLDEPKNHVALAFKKAISFPKHSICDYVEAMGTAGLEHIIPEIFNPFHANCKNEIPEAFNLSDYIQTNNLDAALVKLIDDIQTRDVSVRRQKKKDVNAMKASDVKNQKLIDSLYKVHKTYIGKSFVGERYESTMWLVIQHSNLKMMETYLPVVHQATLDNELDKVPLKMLIDRYYGLKFGYQIFGSQNGFDFKDADKSTREAIRKKYNLED